MYCMGVPIILLQGRRYLIALQAPEFNSIFSRHCISSVITSNISELAGNEDVKLAILAAISSWAARFSNAVQSDLVSFISSGLKEKEALRRGHLCCLRAICRRPDSLLQVKSI